PTGGAISLAPARTVGYLRQGFADLPEGTLGDLLDIPTRGLFSAQVQMDASALALGDPGDPDMLADAFDRATAVFEAAGGYAALDELDALLDRFGLGDVALDRLLATLSGGQKTRAGLAGLLASRPDLLVLDEPTNHLDIDALDWLAQFLVRSNSAVLMVSHDRGFLDQVATDIFELDGITHRLTIYPGNYSEYAEQKRHAEEEHAAAWARQQKEVRRIKEDIRRMEHHARTIEANTIDYAVRKKAAKIARPAVVRKAKLERMLDSEEAIDRPSQSWGLAMELKGISGGARDVVSLEGVSVAFGGTEVLHGVSLDVQHGDRVALIGPNGSGKSTLIKIIAGLVEPTDGRVRLGTNVNVGYFAQEQDSLDLERTVLETARRGAAMSESDTRTFLHRFLFAGEMVHRKVAELSYGERARLMLALLVLQGTNLLLLDEPLNHLDISSRENFERALVQFEGTMILVLHDRYAVERLASRVVEIRDGVAVEIDPATIATKVSA
ncbi:MAG TPA: ABC-F family ATP-binding cassette domain-containing protein, partial [Thermomicrobiales bacterium]|nr:ABC-F family ATP-binding cassette domain-containing protein [Thermomicrobiales bacterium]